MKTLLEALCEVDDARVVAAAQLLLEGPEDAEMGELLVWAIEPFWSQIRRLHTKPHAL